MDNYGNTTGGNDCRYQHPTNTTKMANDIGPKKTMVVVFIVVGCFAVLWPKVFYPMLVGPPHQAPIGNDRVSGCCDVLSETDVNTIKIMSELCKNNIVATSSSDGKRPLSGKEIVAACRQVVLERCDIDISVVLQEQIRLGHTFKQIIDEVRSLNGSLCLQHNFGIAPVTLGVRHLIDIDMMQKPKIKQERPPHLRTDLIHPAFRERGSAIPKPAASKPNRPPPRIVEGRPGPMPGMRPTIGGAGHVVPPSQKGTSSMSIIMPIYTVGIVIFFTYTLMKLLFKKQPDPSSLYPSIPPDPIFRKDVFESQANYVPSRRDSRLVVNAMSALLEEVDQEIEARRIANEQSNQQIVNGNLRNGSVREECEDDHQQQQQASTLKVLGMEMTASREGGKRWGDSHTPLISISPPAAEHVEPPPEIYLEGALPAQSKILVADATTEQDDAALDADPAVVLAGKVTLSVINDSSNDDDGDEMNGDDLDDEPIEESKYTTASSATAAEQEVSDPEEKTDDEADVDDEIGELIEEIAMDEEIIDGDHVEVVKNHEKTSVEEVVSCNNSNHNVESSEE